MDLILDVEINSSNFFWKSQNFYLPISIRRFFFIRLFFFMRIEQIQDIIIFNRLYSSDT